MINYRICNSVRLKHVKSVYQLIPMHVYMDVSLIAFSRAGAQVSKCFQDCTLTGILDMFIQKSWATEVTYTVSNCFRITASYPSCVFELFFSIEYSHFIFGEGDIFLHYQNCFIGKDCVCVRLLC